MNMLVKVSRLQFYIASFMIIGFALIGKQFIIIWAGEQYINSYYIALVIMVPQIFSIVQTLFSTMLEAMNKHKVKSLIYLGVALINLILTLILVKFLGLIGCALGTAVGMLINALLNNLYYKYILNLDMKYYWKQISGMVIPMIAIMIVGMFISLIIDLNSYVDILLFIVTFTIAYFVMSWKFIFNKYEKSLINSILYKFNIKKSQIKEIL